MSRPPFKKQVSGFTLVELLVSLISIIVLSGVLMVIYVTVTNSLRVLMNRTTVTTQLRTAVEQIERDVHMAKQVAAGGGCPAFVQDGSLIIVEIPDGTNPAVMARRIRYRLNGSVLEQQDLSVVDCSAQGTARQLAQNVTALAFRQMTAKAVRMLITLTSGNSPGNRVTSSIAVLDQMRQP